MGMHFKDNLEACVAPDGHLESCFIENLGKHDPIKAYDARDMAYRINEDKIKKDLAWIFVLIRKLSEKGSYAIKFPLEMNMSKDEALEYIGNPVFKNKVKTTLSGSDTLIVRISSEIDKYQIKMLKDLGYKIKEDGFNNGVYCADVVTEISWDI